MTRTWLVRAEVQWEALNGASAVASLDIHPSGDFVAMQVCPSDSSVNERAAVWNSHTHSIVWNPGNATAMCWMQNGREILVVEEQSCRSCIRTPINRIFVTSLQSERRQVARRLSWPGLETIASIELEIPHGWIVDVVASPQNDSAYVVWMDQCEAGVEIVSTTDGGLRQLHRRGFEYNSNHIQGPVFSPDAGTIAMTFGAGVWWAEEPTLPCTGGNRHIGCLVWSESESGVYRCVDIDGWLPEGWIPQNPEDMLRNEFLSIPMFVGNSEVKLVLPTGEERFVSL